jgi:hypothetical protein
LPLLVARIFTNHANDAVTTDDLALFTDFLDAGTNLHFLAPSEFLGDLTPIGVGRGKPNFHAVSRDESDNRGTSRASKTSANAATGGESDAIHGARQDLHYGAGFVLGAGRGSLLSMNVV